MEEKRIERKEREGRKEMLDWRKEKKCWRHKEEIQDKGK